MNHILNSVIEVTQHKDLEALEKSFVETLASLVPAEKVELNHFQLDKQGKNIVNTVQVIHYTHDDKHSSHILKGCEVSPAVLGCVTANFTLLAPLSDTKWHFILPVMVNEQIEGCISFISKTDLTEYREIIEAFVAIYGNFLNIINENERDELTGLLNRKSFNKRIKRLLSVQKSEQARHLKDDSVPNRRRALSEKTAWLAILDIDHFKNVNDTFGHIYGDEVLLLLSQKLKNNFRHSDIPFRFGGEEFVIVLEPTDEQSVDYVLERFRSEIEQSDFPRVGKITISIGYAQLGNDDFPPHVIESADKALYFAKENGRNKVFRYETLIKHGSLSKPDSDSSIELF